MIADMLNIFFANIGKDLAFSIPNVGMSQSKATGRFSIPVTIFKILKTDISKPLEVLFNACFETGIVPDSFKLANVIPIYTKGSQNCLSNYLPISLLSGFNKWP